MPAKRTQTSDLLGAPRSGAQTVLVPRVRGGARKALLRHRGNKTVHRRLGEYAPRRGGHAGRTFVDYGGGTQLPTRSRAALSVMKPAGKEVFNVEKKCDISVFRL